MTKVMTQPKVSTENDPVQYLHFSKFYERISRTDATNPYSSTFSFVPFIQKMKKTRKETSGAACTMDASAFEHMEKDLISYSDPEQLDTPEKRQAIISTFFPSLFIEGQMGFIAQPFTKQFFFTTPALQEFFYCPDWEIKVTGDLAKAKMGSPAMEAGKLVLSSLYNRTLESSSYQTMTFRNKKTLLERHFKINIVLDFIKTTALKAQEPLDDKRFYELMNEWGNEAYWLEHFPPEDYVFEGFVIGYIQDVTEVEVLSQMKEMMVSGDGGEDIENADNMRQQLNSLICSYLQMPDIEFGYLQDREFKYAKLISWSIIGDLSVLERFANEEYCQSITYGKVRGSLDALAIGDLQQLENPGRIEQHLIDLGYRSLLLAPQRDRNGKLIGFTELASKQPYRFSKQVLDRLREVLSLYGVGTNRWIQETDNNVNFFIQKQFTYIHPSVEWKFQEVSQKALFTPQEEGKGPAIDPIVFKDVYPLYGQADIVGSSKIRNRSIEADMLDNLQRAHKVMKAFRKRLAFQLLDVYMAKAEAFIQRLENGGYVSSDESQIVELLTHEIHPLLGELGEKYSNLPKTILKRYFDYLDPKLGIVYRQRKDYEDSVQGINDLISAYVDREVAKKQEILPHFFEKYITDGVEYNIYLGQSLLHEGKFSNFFLQDFRLWQLILMCEVTRLVERNGQKFAVPLSTAQLIFVYNNALSIRFIMDEKQFDVDGAYNVRYEILKKRIDKAVIKGTGERLTVKGKVAIVWLQEKDRIEYMEYINHLLQQGYITDDIEELELERLQGADGLKALRVTVAV